jgi:hypothetical protein
MHGTLRKVLSIAAFVAGLGYAIWAQMADPPLFPAREIIGLQAFWNDGRYAVKMTAMTSLFTMLAIAGLAALPIALIARLVTAGRRDPTAAVHLPELAPGWTVELERPRALPYVGAAVGLAIGIFHLRTLVFAPEWFEPYGGPGGLLGMLILLLGPVAAMAGEFFAVEAIMGTGAIEGTIENLTLQARGRNITRHVVVGGQSFVVPAAVYGRLQKGRKAAVVYAGGTRRLLELRQSAG